MATAKNSRLILSERLNFSMIDSLVLAFYAFPIRISTSITVDEILLPRYVN